MFEKAQEKTIQLSSILKVPAMVIGAIAAFGVGLSALGFEVRSPGVGLRDHIEIDHARLDSAISMLSDNYNQRTDLMRALVVGYCIEHDKETLDRARLTATCRKEGIDK